MTATLPKELAPYAKQPRSRGPISDALDQAAQFDPWETVEEDDERLFTPDEFTPPPTPPPDSAYAILPDSREDLPWNRDIAAGETTGEHNAFRHYVALGSARTLKKVSDDLDTSYKTISSLAAKYDWLARASAFDAYADEQYEHALLDRIKDMANRHAATFSSALQSLAVAFQPLSDPDTIAAELRAVPVARRMQLAIQAAKAMPGLAAAERLALGMPTEIKSETNTTTVKYEPNLSELKATLQGLMEANALDKVSSREKIDAEVDGEISDAEIVES